MQGVGGAEQAVAGRERAGKLEAEHGITRHGGSGHAAPRSHTHPMPHGQSRQHVVPGDHHRPDISGLQTQNRFGGIRLRLIPGRRHERQPLHPSGIRSRGFPSCHLWKPRIRTPSGEGCVQPNGYHRGQMDSTHSQASLCSMQQKLPFQYTPRTPAARLCGSSTDSGRCTVHAVWQV